MLSTNNSLLSQNPFNVLGSYEPNFLLTKINIKNDLRKKDIDSDEFMYEAFRYSSTTVHENMHWNQFAGTTWGNWCMFIYQSRYNLFFDSINQPIVSEVVDNISQFKPNDDYTFNQDIRKKFPESHCLFYNDWLSHTITYNFFLNGGYDYERVLGLHGRVATSMSFAYFSVNNFLKLGERGTIGEYEDKLHFKNLSLIKPGGVNVLTVKTLLEGQARASEWLHLATLLQFKHNPEKFEKFITPILNYSDTYWSAFHLYLERNDLDLIDIVNKGKIAEELTKFCILVDIALNPPIVPFYPKEELGKTDWLTIFPPATFFKACIVSNNLKTNLDIFDEEAIQKYYELICSHLGRPTPRELAKYFMSHNSKRISQISKKWESKPVQWEKMEYNDYLFYVISKFCEVRIKFPVYIFNLGLASTGEHSRKNVRMLINYNREYDFITSSPLILNKNKKEFDLFTPLHHEEGNQIFYWLSVNLLFNHIISNNLILNKKLSNLNFPFNVPSYVQSQVVQLIQKYFGIQTKWNINKARS